ncbi:MAG: glycosyltransferase family 1 protein [Proteobacteria bacterium]|nr:glycosyltransferase family 1 protein [Pseudomonadota bacterium]
MRVVLFKGPSQYEGTRTFIDELARAFAARGYEPAIFDLAGSADVEAAIAGAAGPPTALVFSINILGEHRDREGRNISEIFQAPHVVLSVDYVLSLASRWRATPTTTSLLCVDPSQVDAVNSIFGPDRFASVAFCPHAAVGEPWQDADLDGFLERREIPILWSGSFQRPGTPIWDGQPPQVRKLYDDAVDLALSVEWMPPLDALDQVLRANGADPTNPALQTARCDACHIDARVRVIRRFEMISRLAESGLPLAICGLGWDGANLPNARLLGPLPMPEAARAMTRSRIVLNTNGNFGAGSHERPLSALLAGAAAFSDASAFYLDSFVEDEEIVLYRWKDLDAGIERLARLHADPEAAFRIAQRGGAKVRAGHRWANRLDIILAAAEASRQKLRLKSV